MLSLMTDTTSNNINKCVQSSKVINKKSFQSNIPAPYGSIPKRNKKSTASHIKNHSNENNLRITKKSSRNNSSSSSAPYPFFSSLAPTSSSFLSIFNNFFNNNGKIEEKPVGFMPRTTMNRKMSQVVVDIAVSSPIDCYYYGNSSINGEHQDTMSSSSSSSESSSSLGSIFSLYMEDDNIRNSVRNNSCSNTSVLLSDILCDHYVQTQMNNPPSASDVIIDVPLETFRMFEAPPTTNITNAGDTCSSTAATANSYEYWMTIDEQQSTRQWTLVEETNQIKQSATTAIEKEQEKEVVEEEKEADTTLQLYSRDIRANGAYLRMIVAEVNMMRSQKIVGPLRPRRVLPKRLDKFMHCPSPLITVTA